MWKQRKQRRKAEIRIAQIRADTNWVWELRYAEALFDHFTLRKTADGLNAMAESMEHRLLGRV